VAAHLRLGGALGHYAGMTTFLTLSRLMILCTATVGGHSATRPVIRFADIPGPSILQGDRTNGYRDPAGACYDGTFHLFHTLARLDSDGHYYWHVAVTKSDDLIHWTPPRIITPKDQRLNYSSPGNVIRFRDRWLMCLQTYPTPKNQTTGDETSRLWLMESRDLENWGPPHLMKVKGPDVPVEKMGRMIDPYLVQDKDEPGKWRCFYRQNGASMSYSHDLEIWTYAGRVDAGENSCVLVDKDEYVLIHSPSNGICFKRSQDLKTWRDDGAIYRGQKDWPWAKARLTAAQVLDLRDEPGVGVWPAATSSVIHIVLPRDSKSVTDNSVFFD
jgi:hypothetical protein